MSAASNLAKTIFSDLTAGTNFTAPAPDLSASVYAVPESGETNVLYGPVSPISVTELTSGLVDGDGIFDKIMQSMNAQLDSQFKKGRIQGAEYAQVYISMIQSSLGAATQLLMGQDQALYQAHLVQQQARAAEVAVVQARIALEMAKQQTKSAEIEVQLASTNYAIAQMRLSTEDAQVRSIEAQVVQTQYNTQSLMPAELARLNKQVDVMSSEIALGDARKAQVTYETTSIMPIQRDTLLADKAIKDYQLSDQLPGQVANTTVDTQIKTYTKDLILPEQKKLAAEQYEIARAKTKDVRSDSTEINGTIRRENDLLEQQKASYKSEAQLKLGRMILETWMTNKSMDEGLTTPSSLNDANINNVVNSIRVNLGLSNV